MRIASMRRGSLAAVVWLLAGGVSAAATTSGDAYVHVEGVFERIQSEAVPADAARVTASGHEDHDTHDGEGMLHALRLDDGTRVALDGAAVSGLGTGSRVSVVAPVPPVVVETIGSGRPVTDEDGRQVNVATRDIFVAKRIPADEGSNLSRAVLGSAVQTGRALRANSVKVLAAGEQGYTRGSHKVHIVSVVPRGLKASAATAAQLRGQVASASGYWSDQSGGGVSFGVAQVGTSYTSAFKCGDDPFAFWNEAARRMNYTEGADKHLVVVFPRAAADAGCSYGLASIGSSPNAGGVVLVSDNSWPVLAHEIGHNLGLGHAKVNRSRLADVDLGGSTRGNVEDYGDPYDVMAASAADRAGMLSTLQAANIGILQAPALAQAPSGTKAFTLTPLSSLRGLRGIKVVDPVTKDEYFVEYRTRTGRDALLYRNMAAGVRVLKADPTDYQSRASVVMDASPTGASNDHSWHVAPRGAFLSRSGNVRITVNAVAAGSASVTVTVGAAARKAAAAAPGALAAPKVAVPAVSSTRADGKVAVSWSGAPAGAVYDVRYRTIGVAAGKPSPGAVRMWLTGTASGSAVLAGTQGGVYEFSARVRNSRGASAWTPWAKAVVPVDSTARGTRAVGRWAAGRSSAYTYGTFHSTSARNASITGVRTHTNRIHVVGAKHARGSVAHVYVNGKLAAKVDTYAAKTQTRATIASIPVAWGAHTVKVVNVPSGARNQLVVDGFAYAR